MFRFCLSEAADPMGRGWGQKGRRSTQKGTCPSEKGVTGQGLMQSEGQKGSNLSVHQEPATAADLLAALRGRGFRLEGREGHRQLVVTPGSAMSEADRAAVRTHKEALLDLLWREEGEREWLEWARPGFGKAGRRRAPNRRRGA